MGEPIFSVTLGDDAISAISRVVPAISADECRYYLNGIYLHKGDGPWDYRAVATDGHRLHIVNLELPDAAGDLRPLIVPRSAIERALRVLKGPLRLEIGPALFRNRDNTLVPDNPKAYRVRFSAENAALTSRLVDGTYPDYKRVIPQAPAYQATLERRHFLRALAAVVPGAKRARRGVSPCAAMKFEGGLLRLWSRWAWNDGRAQVDISCESNIPAGFEVGVNAGYLAEILGVLRGDRVTMMFNAKDGNPCNTDPITVVSPDDGNFKAVQMPMRI